jgi:hypothetical protein
MFKKTLTIALAGLLIQAVCAQPASAASKAEKQAQRTEKVKAEIMKLGVGTDTRVAIKLRDDVKLAGYISEATEGSFAVTDPRFEVATARHGDVTQVKGITLGQGRKSRSGSESELD